MNTSANLDKSLAYKNLSLETLKDEFWLPIPKYEQFYKVSNLGRVQSLDRQRWTGSGYHLKEGIILKQSLTTTGYLRVNLCEKGNRKVWKVHQLVAITFLSHTPCGLIRVVDHIDGNPLNNKLSNLRIVTNRENTNNSRKNTLSKFIGVSWNHNAGKWRASIVVSRKLIHLGYYSDEKKAAEAYRNAFNLVNNNMDLRNQFKLQLIS
ncbi:NUMOD4 motif-containing HNH endonuclease [Christiangramia forsetii]|uniref:HNH endonuclease family protein n=2 Tax=Christiangramia forsetii TaxID=411153 RepID=A0M4A7_CHRFK|nr:NUMOD4 motif-containing HNH endonuclease [Christiangramia forsetii]GGG23852.1 hypothetical protein GCM10011532_03820 [Christiangramia forsetii]CAL67452.1 HNH endonuclease family protein [Christiangramia forsetii KT0803]